MGNEPEQEVLVSTELGEVKPEPTESELMASLESALKSKDFKAVAAASRKLDTAVKTKEKAEQEVAKAAETGVAKKVGEIILKALKSMVDAGELDKYQGIWYSQDFEEVAPVIRLTKTAPRAARSGGSSGGGKKFDISTDDMLARHGADEYKDGLSFQQAYESSTDKNHRYAIRQKLLKLEGVI